MQHGRSAHRCLRVDHHLFQLGLVALPSLVIGRRKCVDRLNKKLRCYFVLSTTVSANQPGLLEHREHDANLSRADRWNAGTNRLKVERSTRRGSAQGVDQRVEICVDRIPTRHEERLQTAVTALKEQNASAGRPSRPARPDSW